MKTTQSILTSEDNNTIYEMVEEFFGSMKADAVYYDLTHQQY
jgi:hypothetical protein